MKQAILAIGMLGLMGCAATTAFINGPSFNPLIEEAAKLGCAQLTIAQKAAAAPILVNIQAAAEAGNGQLALSTAVDNATVSAIGWVWYAVDQVLKQQAPSAAAYTAALLGALDAAAQGCLAA